MDSYRTIAYPLDLRIVDVIPGVHGPTIALYLLQWICSYGAIFYFVRTLDRLLGAGHNTGLSAFVAAAASFFPLTAHFGSTILPDSLAASAALLALGGCLRVLADGARGCDFITATLGLMLAAFIRPERMLLLGGLLGMTLALYILRRNLRRVVASCALLAAAILPTTIVNGLTQTADYGRPELTIATRLFDRTVSGRLTEIQPNLPKHLQAFITIDDARRVDRDSNEIAPITNRIIAQEGEDMVFEVVRFAFRCCWFDIVVEAALDAVEYTLAPWNWVRESLWSGGDRWTDWANTRMAHGHRHLTLGFLVLGTLVLLTDSAIFAARFRFLLREAGGRRLLGVLAGTTGSLGLLYSSTAGLDAHIRYALPTVVVWQALLTWTAMRWAVSDRCEITQSRAAYTHRPENATQTPGEPS